MPNYASYRHFIYTSPQPPPFYLISSSIQLNSLSLIDFTQPKTSKPMTTKFHSEKSNCLLFRPSTAFISHSDKQKLDSKLEVEKLSWAIYWEQKSSISASSPTLADEEESKANRVCAAKRMKLPRSIPSISSHSTLIIILSSALQSEAKSHKKFQLEASKIFASD